MDEWVGGQVDELMNGWIGFPIYGYMDFKLNRCEMLLK